MSSPIATPGVRLLGRIPALDGVRAVAILLVLFHHNLRFIFPAGNSGVDVFFVVSGFLITGLLISEFEGRRSISLRRFYVRRLLRLYPALVVMLGAFAVLSLTMGHSHHLLGAAFGVTYTTNFAAFLTHQVPDPLKHLWSLAQEEQFYLLWPALLFGVLAMGWPRKRIMVLTALAVAIGPIMSLVYWQIGAGPVRVFFSPDAHSTGLVIGCLLGEIYVWKPQSRLFIEHPLHRFAWPAAAIGLWLAAVGLRDALPSIFGEVINIPLFSILGGLLVISAVTCSRGWFLRVATHAWVSHLGKISYGLYLWHYPVKYFVEAHLHTAFRYVFIAEMVLAYVMAELSWRFVEVYFLRLKQRFEPDRVLPPVESQAGAFVRAGEKAAS